MRKRTIAVELTSLLDVILIIMFLVLVQSEGRVGHAYAEASEEYASQIEELREEISGGAAEKDRLAAELEALRIGLEEESHIILLTLQADENGRASRAIFLEGAVAEEIRLSWDADIREQAALKLNESLTARIGGAAEGQVTFIIFRFNSSEIYEDDYRLITLAVQRQKQESFHIFTAEIDLRKDNR
jgi:hypothetical protein